MRDHTEHLHRGAFTLHAILFALPIVAGLACTATAYAVEEPTDEPQIDEEEIEVETPEADEPADPADTDPRTIWNPKTRLL